MLDMPEVRAFALKSLDRVLAEAWNAEARTGACGGVWRGGRRRQRAWPGCWTTMCFWGMRRWMRGRRRARCGTTTRRQEIDGERAGAVLRCGGRRVLRYRDAGGGRAQAGRSGDAAEAVAGLAYAGGESDGGGAADAAGGVERAAGLRGEGAGDAGDVCRSGGALWAVCGELWAGAAADGAASRCRCA